MLPVPVTLTPAAGWLRQEFVPWAQKYTEVAPTTKFAPFIVALKATPPTGLVEGVNALMLGTAAS